MAAKDQVRKPMFTGAGPQRFVLFAPGLIKITPCALAVLREAEMRYETLLRRHVGGDWGDVDDQDWDLNDRAVEQETPVVSAYRVLGTDVLVITYFDRGETLVILRRELQQPRHTRLLEP